jgi:hypothetical protein
MLDYVPGTSQTIIGHNKTVEIDDSTFIRRKYNRGRKVGQCVFSGDEPESGKEISSSSSGQTADTLLAVLRTWIEHGTIVMSDCLSALRYRNARLHTQKSESFENFL